MEFLESLQFDRLERQAGTAVLVFPTGELDANAFLRYVLMVRRPHELVLLVRPRAELVPHIAVEQQLHANNLTAGMHLVDISFGFDDEPDVPQALAGRDALQLDPSITRYYVAEDRTVAAAMRGMSSWRAALFKLLCAASAPAAEYFRLPAHKTIVIPPRVDESALISRPAAHQRPQPERRPSAG